MSKWPLDRNHEDVYLRGEGSGFLLPGGVKYFHFGPVVGEEGFEPLTSWFATTSSNPHSIYSLFIMILNYELRKTRNHRKFLPT